MPKNKIRKTKEPAVTGMKGMTSFTSSIENMEAARAMGNEI
jgi:hypothetical protein